MSFLSDDENYYSVYETTLGLFGSRAVQLNPIKYRSRAGVDIIPINFFHFRVFTEYNPFIRRYVTDPPTLLRKRTLKLRFSRDKASGDSKTRMKRFEWYRGVIARSPKEANKLKNKLGRFLSKAMLLPESKHSYIIEPLLDKLQTADPDKSIDVVIQEMTARDTEESMHMNLDFKPKLIPASESFIQGLEEAISPPAGDGLEDCAICMEMLAQKSIKLPCSHYYHRDCLVRWLQINHVCPTCRRPYPQSTQGS